MKGHDDVVLSHIRYVLRRFTALKPDSIVSASIVGSRAPASEEVAGGDFDVVLLLNDLSLSDSIHHALSPPPGDDGWAVVSTWGVVNPFVVGTPTVHLLIDPVAHYRSVRSSLFRRSVAKYPPLLGKPLAGFVPDGPLSGREVHDDWDGPARLLRWLEQEKFESRTWQRNTQGAYDLVVSPNTTATPLDHALYAALHSARNLLRQRNAYREFSSTADLPQQWFDVFQEGADTLQSLVSAKAIRRAGQNFDAASEGEVVRAAIGFLRSCLKLIAQPSAPTQSYDLHP